MSIIRDIKDVASIVQKAGNIDLYKRILDLQAEALEMLEQNSELKNQINELKAKLSTKEKLIFKNSKYYFDETGPSHKGPFCTKCWDTEGKLVNLQDNYSGYYRCPNCNMTVKGDTRYHNEDY